LSDFGRYCQPMTKTLPYQQRHIVFSERLSTCIEDGAGHLATKSPLNPLGREVPEAVDDLVGSSFP
jgi:hypothetical protein